MARQWLNLSPMTKKHYAKHNKLRQLDARRRSVAWTRTGGDAKVRGWSPQNDFNETLYANIVYIYTYTCVTVSYMYAWLFVQRANKVNNRFMSLLKKDNRWVATAFYFTFFPPLSHCTSDCPGCCCLCCILWLSLRLFMCGMEKEMSGRVPSSSVLRVRVAFM